MWNKVSGLLAAIVTATLLGCGGGNKAPDKEPSTASPAKPEKAKQRPPAPPPPP